MNDGEEFAPGGRAQRGGGAGDDRLARATTLLRRHTDAGWKAIEGDVLARALTLFRPSAPVRGRHELGDFLVASDVVVARLRLVVDAVPRAAAAGITCTTDGQDHLESVTVQLVVAYGSSLLEVAGRVHAVAVQELRDVLGPLAPRAEAVRTHVHVGDVSDDPRIVS